VRLSKKTGFLIFLLLLSVSLYAFDFGIRFSLGLSSGIGRGWDKMLDEAGSRAYSDTLGTAGIGLFAEYRLNQTLFFSPEINFVLNRGVRMSSGSGDSIRTASEGSLELILPLSREFPISQSRAYRMTGGLQLLLAPQLIEEHQINEMRQTQNLRNDTPLSIGMVLGGGMVFRRDRKVSWITDLRLKLPITDNISLTAANGSSLHLKTVELLAGTGVRF